MDWVDDSMPWNKAVTDRKQPPRQLTLGEAFDDRSRHRLFFGLWPDADATESLTKLIVQLRRDRIMLGKPVNPDRFHLTLHHLGDFIDQIPPDLLPTARAAAATVQVKPFEVVFDRIGGTKGPLLLRPSSGSAALTHFQKTLCDALIKAGLRRSVQRALSPHVTLSYDFSDVSEMTIEPIGWTVQEFILVESLIGKHRHLRKGRWPLQSYLDATQAEVDGTLAPTLMSPFKPSGAHR